MLRAKAKETGRDSVTIEPQSKETRAWYRKGYDRGYYDGYSQGMAATDLASGIPFQSPAAGESPAHICGNPGCAMNEETGYCWRCHG